MYRAGGEIAFNLANGSKSGHLRRQTAVNAGEKKGYSLGSKLNWLSVVKSPKPEIVHDGYCDHHIRREGGDAAQTSHQVNC